MMRRERPLKAGARVRVDVPGHRRHGEHGTVEFAATAEGPVRVLLDIGRTFDCGTAEVAVLRPHLSFTKVKEARLNRGRPKGQMTHRRRAVLAAYQDAVASGVRVSLSRMARECGLHDRRGLNRVLRDLRAMGRLPA